MIYKNVWEKSNIINELSEDCFDFEENFVSTYLIMDIKRPFNSKHPIVKFLIKNSVIIKADHEIWNLFKNYFEILSDFMFDINHSGMNNPQRYIDKMNYLLKEINKRINTNFVLSKRDFPPWMRNKL